MVLSQMEIRYGFPAKWRMFVWLEVLVVITFFSVFFLLSSGGIMGPAFLNRRSVLERDT